MNLVNIYYTLCLFCLVGGSITGMIMWLTTGRYFDKLLKTKNIPLPISYAFNLPESMGRISRYVIYIVLKKPRKKDLYRIDTGEFDFRENARNIDVFFAFFMFVIFIITLILIVIPTLLSFFYQAYKFLV